jgi:shikimate kinase
LRVDRLKPERHSLPWQAAAQPETHRAMSEPDRSPDAPARIERLRTALAGRSVVLVGMMGAGKTTIGKRLAARIGLDFIDADAEIEKAAAQSIPEIFAQHGEAHFRQGERRVIQRILAAGQSVLATGGGAFMNAETRASIAGAGLSVWLKAEFDVLMARVRRKSNRPLLQNPDPEGTMRRLIDERYPVYALADITVLSRDVQHDVITDEIIDALIAHGAPVPSSTGASP